MSPVHFIALPRPACLRISSSFRIRLTSPSFMLYLPSLKRTPLLLLPVLWLVLCALLMALRNSFFPAQHTASENAHSSAFYSKRESENVFRSIVFGFIRGSRRESNQGRPHAQASISTSSHTTRPQLLDSEEGIYGFTFSYWEEWRGATTDERTRLSNKPHRPTRAKVIGQATASQAAPP